MDDLNAAFSGTKASGAYSARDAADLLESAVNQVIASDPQTYSPTVDAAQAVGVIASLETLIGNLPKQTVRDEEQERLQQFSTPPHLAYVVAWAANLSPTDVVLEPSAGVGGLAVFALNAGCKVYANEISERRSKLLALLPLAERFNENAEQLHAILPDYVRPSVVLMNPPFSKAGTRLGNRRVKGGGLRHVDQCLARLLPGGRLVTILPNGRDEEMTKGMTAWVAGLAGRYTLRANIAFPRTIYGRYGTNFPCRMMVIDKAKVDAKVVEGDVNGLNESLLKLNCVRESRQGLSCEYSYDRPAPQPANADSVQDVDMFGQAIGKASVASKVVVEGTREEPNIVIDAPTLAIAEMPAEATVPISDAIFEPYRPQRLRIEGAHEHPTPLVQSAAMASVLPPPPTYAPALPFDLVESGTLSDAQLEAIVYAGQAHREFLPETTVDGRTVKYRKGFFCGDSMGVGKGRTLCGIILDHFQRGGRKAIWISANNKLIRDAIRDWIDLGGEPSEIISLAKIGASKSIPRVPGRQILFCTYALLRSGAQQQIRDPMDRRIKSTDIEGYQEYEEWQLRPLVRLANDPNPTSWHRAKWQNTQAGKYRHYNLGNACEMVEPDFEGVPSKRTIWKVLGINPEQAVSEKSKASKRSRLEQILEWAGPNFEGPICADESHRCKSASEV